MTTAGRPLRVDASRNRVALLAAAQAEFTDHGVSASIADVARRAGVAKATVFRHFATKEDLIAAVVEEHIAGFTARARQLSTDGEPDTALFTFLHVAAEQRRHHDLTYLQAAAANDTAVLDARDDLLAAIEDLVVAARRAGALRTDVTATDVFLMMCAPIHVVEGLADPEPDLWQRYLGIIVDGLRPDGASALPRPAPRLPRADGRP